VWGGGGGGWQKQVHLGKLPITPIC